MAVPVLSERALVEHGLAALGELLGSDFEVTPSTDQSSKQLARDFQADAVYTVGARDVSSPTAQVVVEAKSSLTPSMVRETLAPRVRLLRRLYDRIAVLVVAPWLSPRTREALAGFNVSYLDLTGNVDLRLPTGVLIRTEGAQHNPHPAAERRGRGLTGAAASIVTRLLVDFAPPYRQKDLAAVAHVSAGYVSRIVQTLDDEALISRDGADIVNADWQGLLRARAATTDLLRSNRSTPMVARKGPDSVYRTLFAQGTDSAVVVTGSYAAREVAPVAVGGSLMIYVQPGPREAEAVADELSLLPTAGTSGNVLLLQPPNNGPFERVRAFGTSYQVALSQLVIDCLSGPGRMPAEGEAVLSHMAVDETIWRRGRGQLALEAAAAS